jgi:hypothetical protein
VGPRPQTDALRGSLDLLVLKTLSLEAMHGWGISQRLQQISRGVLEVNQGSLYPALQRLEKEGLINERVGDDGQQSARALLGVAEPVTAQRTEATTRRAVMVRVPVRHPTSRAQTVTTRRRATVRRVLAARSRATVRRATLGRVPTRRRQAGTVVVRRVPSATRRRQAHTIDVRRPATARRVEVRRVPVRF